MEKLQETLVNLQEKYGISDDDMTVLVEAIDGAANESAEATADGENGEG